MSQGDCVRVQTAQFGIQKAARKGLLPLDPRRLIAVLREPHGPFPLPLTEEERLLVAMHLESCNTCLAFWEEQLRLGVLLGEAGFDLPPQATDLEINRLEKRVLELASSSQPGKPSSPAKFEDYLTEKREVRVSSKYQVKKLALVAAGVLVVVLGVVYFSFLYPPVQKEDVQGAIGKRDVYRETNMTEKDVTANSGTGGASFAGLFEFLKSPEFKALASNSNYQSLVNNGAAFSQLVNNDSFHAVCSQIQNNQGNGLVSSLSFLVQSGLSQNNNFQQLFQSQQFQQVLASCSNAQELQHNSILSSNAAFQSMVHNNQFNQAMENAAFYSFIHQNAHSLGDLSTMINNSAFQQLATNSNAFQNLVQNNAFNSLINNQVFQLGILASSLQNNNAFNSLVTNNNFVGLVNSSEFHALASNSTFQQLLQDSNFHQVVMNQEQGSLANNNQFNQLINSAQYQSLASNNNFQSLVHNNNFNGLIHNNAFQNMIQNNQFQLFLFNQQLGTYASSAAGLNGLMQQSQELGIVVPQ